MKARLMRLLEWLVLFLAFTGAADAQAHRRKAWRQGVVTNGLEIWWRMMPGQETVDSSGNGRTLTLYNSPTPVAGPGSGGALSFNGVNKIAQYATGLGSLPAISVSCFVAANAVSPPDAVLVGENNAFVEYQLLWYASANTMYWQIQDTSNNFTNGSNSYVMNHTNWIHIVGTYSPGATRLYINGVLGSGVGTTTTGLVKDGAGVSAVGGQFNGAASFYFNGRIADVRIYNRALTAAEVETIRTNP
jgi:hypothetical protein